MLASMLYLYPRTAVDEKALASLRAQEDAICQHWGFPPAPDAPVVCAGLFQGQIDAIKQALQKGETGASLRAIVGMVQEPKTAQALKDMVVEVAGRHPSGFILKWVDLNHPDGYSYVVVGFVV